MIKEHFALKGYIERHFNVKIVAKMFRGVVYYFVLEKLCAFGDEWWELKYKTAFDYLSDVYDRLKEDEEKNNE